MAETKMQLVDWLDDLCVRFIINLPREELESVERICFQVEEAQWFYEDFVRPLDPTLPSLSLKQFCFAVFTQCPLFTGFTSDLYIQAFSEWLSYKTRVPVRGAIMLNDAMDQVLLVKGWKKGASWSFPRGKINKDEDDLVCAIREVYEETGYDIEAAGLVPKDRDVKYIEVNMKGQHMKLFVFKNVPMETLFQPRTRKEISKIQWYRLANLPGYNKKVKASATGEQTLSANKLYMVAPFLGPLKKWINQQRRQTGHATSSGGEHLGMISGYDDFETDGNFTADDEQHLDRAQASKHLLSQLAPQTAGAADTAAELKRLLAVGPSLAPAVGQTLGGLPGGAPPSAIHPDSQNLLALLQSGGSSQPQSSTAQVPTVSLPPPASLPQQQFQTTSHQQALLNVFQQRPQQPQLGVQQLTSLPMHTRSASGFSAPIPSAESGPAPFQQVGSAFPQSLHPPNYVEPRAPRASELPQPKLSNHAQGLLSLFQTKTSSTPASTNQTPRAQPSFSTTAPHPPQQRPSPSIPPAKKNSLSLFQPSSVAPRRKDSATSQRTVTQQSTVLSPTALSGLEISLEPTPVARVPSHQDKLLNLFKDRSASNDPTPQQAPAELATSRSPVPTPIEMPAEAFSRPGTKDGSKVMSILQRPRQVEDPELTKLSAPSGGPRPPSASLQSPPHLPDFGTVHRSKPKHAKKPSEGRSSAESTQRTTPIQILKRPQPAQQGAGELQKPTAVEVPANHRQERRPTTPQHHSPRPPKAQPHASKGQSQKPAFQPTILKRPQQASPSPASPPSAASPDLAHAEQQKNALLALLGGQNQGLSHKAQPSENVPPAGGSSNALADLFFSKMDNSTPASDRPPVKERMSSITSSSATPGSQTPMSPADKGFLLNYLDGVVKGHR